MNPSLSRTSSFISDDGSGISTASGEAKRTRKRFTNDQLILLEQLFHETSHPTREQREKLAQKADLELRSVTVWFQNKRQTERKVALTNATNTCSQSSSTTSSTNSKTRRLRVVSSSQPNSMSRLSLDHIASRFEHRIQPKTPIQKRTMSTTGALWESMPSSPTEASPSSPEATRVFIDFAKGKLKKTRTLEWACAAARLADREGKRIEEEVLPMLPMEEDEEKNMGMVVDDEDTEPDDDTHEAITPYNSYREGLMWGIDGVKNSTTTGRANKGRGSLKGTRAHDEETMNAALVLCGLRQ